MFKDRILLLTSDDFYKVCICLLKSNDGSITYCLKFKLWNEPCPPHCDQFTFGEVDSLEEAQSKNYDIDCLDFTRIEQDHPAYYCNLYKQIGPLCHSCQFHRYVTDPLTL